LQIVVDSLSKRYMSFTNAYDGGMESIFCYV
jgi:hypothetical protein